MICLIQDFQYPGQGQGYCLLLSIFRVSSLPLICIGGLYNCLVEMFTRYREYVRYKTLIKYPGQCHYFRCVIICASSLSALIEYFLEVESADGRSFLLYTLCLHGKKT